MIEYEIEKIQDKIINGKQHFVMFVRVDTEMISSTGFSIMFEMTKAEDFNKTFIEQKILEKIETIRKIESMKKSKKIEEVKEKFEKMKGTLD